MSLLKPKRPSTTSAIARYQRTLPKNEWAALYSWLTSFYPFQLDWLLDASDLGICNKSRQIGLSHTTSAVGVIWGAFHGELTTIISIGDRESVEVLEKARKHAFVLAKLGSRMAAVGKTDNANELSFASGGRILALPSSGGRSFTGNVFLDEFAYQEHAGKVWDAAAAVTMLGGKLRVASTPNGVGNDFHQLWQKANEQSSGWAHYEIPIQAAVDDGYPVDIAKCWKLAKGDPRIYDQLFNCSFLDNRLQYIPSDAIDGCSADYNIATIGDGQHYAGLDIGRENDLTVLIVLRVILGVRFVVHVESMKRTDSDGLEAMVARAFERFKLRRLCVDATGLGVFPAERLKKKHTLVEPVNFTPTTKEDLATGLYTAMTGGVMRIPKTDASLPGIEAGTAERLRKDLAAIRRIVTSAGNVRYDAPRTAEGHADHAWALALAHHAAGTANAMAEALRAAAGRA